ncbi:hypothetical protein M0802_015692 [Mischocyttarus mexicanus]|nr:hypothetical protein M0802_015692 [Mischocyttarus mexicanus]
MDIYVAGGRGTRKAAHKGATIPTVAQILGLLLVNIIYFFVCIFNCPIVFNDLGANDNDSYNPQLTSYYFDAPLTEARDQTIKYFRIRSFISKYLPRPIMDIPEVSPKGDYGKVFLQPILELLEPSSRKLFGSPVLYSSKIKIFEELGLPHWLVLYETNKPSNLGESVILNTTVNDRARPSIFFTIENTRRKSRSLSYGENIRDFKGIFNVKIGETPIRNWNITGFRLSNLTGLSRIKNKTITNDTLQNEPVFFRTVFNITKKIFDTYLDTKDWGKGVAFINGNNLSR